MASWCVGFGLACWCHSRVLLEGAAVRGVYLCSRVRSTCVTGAWSSHVGGGAGCLCTVLLEEAGAGLKVQSGALERHAGGGGCCLRVCVPLQSAHTTLTAAPSSSTLPLHGAAAGMSMPAQKRTRRSLSSSTLQQPCISMPTPKCTHL